ncbi:MAG: GntR family transcriptional regulator [Pseudomonadota bacterium]
MSEQPLSLVVADALRGQILRGDFAPEERVQEVALAERMQVSRTPVREALRILSEEGLLTYSPNRGYSVRRFTAEDIRVTFRVRAAMEGIGVRLLAERGVEEKTRRKLESVLADGDALLARGNLPGADLDAWRDMNRRFHVATIVGTHSELLIRVARDSQNIPVVNEGAFRWYLPEDFRRQHMLHHMIADAIFRRQPERAERLMQELIFEAGELVQRHLASSPAPGDA